jgi:hypothetical protein
MSIEPFEQMIASLRPPFSVVIGVSPQKIVVSFQLSVVGYHAFRSVNSK